MGCALSTPQAYFENDSFFDQQVSQQVRVTNALWSIIIIFVILACLITK